jgi:mono/diheme cytochrome c family protein
MQGHPRLPRFSKTLSGLAWAGLLWVATLAAPASNAAAQTPRLAAEATPQDLHLYWDDRCQGCHGHAGEFARRFLRVHEGQLQGQHHRQDLSRFLSQHYLSDALVGPVSAMLVAQVTSPALFKPQCARCHESASAFARQSLLWQGGVLVGRASGKPVADYLVHHGGLAATQIPVVVEELSRVLNEVSPAR